VILGRYRLREKKSLPLREVNDDFSRILQDCQEIIFRAKEMLGAVQPHVSRFDLFTAVKKVLKVSLPPKRWSLAPKKGVFSIEADRGLLETCFIHFIENSRKAVGDDTKLKIDVIIERVAYSGQNWIRVIFSDHGPGIREKFKNRIFDNFFSVPGPSRNRGLGLGLGFVRRVVEAHGGKVWEEGLFGNLTDHGARFIVQLPDVSLDIERGN
jgi:signal transduction histidine kinase